MSRRAARREERSERRARRSECAARPGRERARALHRPLSPAPHLGVQRAVRALQHHLVQRHLQLVHGRVHGVAGVAVAVETANTLVPGRGGLWGRSAFRWGGPRTSRACLPKCAVSPIQAHRPVLCDAVLQEQGVVVGGQLVHPDAGPQALLARLRVLGRRRAHLPLDPGPVCVLVT